MIVAVIVINLSKTKQAHAVPWMLKNALDGCLGTALGLKTINVHVMIRVSHFKIKN